MRRPRRGLLISRLKVRFFHGSPLPPGVTAPRGRWFQTVAYRRHRGPGTYQSRLRRVLFEAGQTRGDLGTHAPRGSGHRKPVARPERPGSVLARSGRDPRGLRDTVGLGDPQCVAVFGDRIASGAFSAGDAESGSKEADSNSTLSFRGPRTMVPKANKPSSFRRKARTGSSAATS